MTTLIQRHKPSLIWAARDLEAAWPVITPLVIQPWYTKPAWWFLLIMILGYFYSYLTKCWDNYTERIFLASLPTPHYCETILHPEQQTYGEFFYTVVTGDSRLLQCQAYTQHLQQTWLANPAVVLCDFLTKLSLTPMVEIGSLLLQVYEKQNFIIRILIIIAMILLGLFLAIIWTLKVSNKIITRINPLTMMENHRD